jgi:YidC/Oxa1 family membrane protein insertase
MDRRSLLLLMFTCLVLVLWYPLMERIYPPKQLPPGSSTNQVAAAGVATNATGAVVPASDGGAGPGSSAVAPPTAVGTAAVRPGVADSGFRAGTVGVEEMTLENADARYVITSAGGGVKQVELKGHLDAVTWRDRRAGKPVGPATVNRGAVTPVFALLGVEAPGADPVYRLTRSNDVVVATRDMGNSLRLVKEFRAGTNHLLHVTTRLQNWGTVPRPLPAQEWVFGTAAPINAAENVMYQGMFEYDGSSSEHIAEAWFANRTLGCFPGTPHSEYLGERTNVVWAAVHNQFFATVVMPRDRAARLFARHIDLPPLPGHVAGAAPAPGYQGALLYGAEQLGAQQERVREFDIYIGPKEYGMISRLGNNADVVMGFDNYFGGRFSGFFARMLLLAMNALHRVGLSYALAIIAITVIVRLLFWPLMASSARMSKRMAALQPQIKELQEKYKENPQKLNQKMLELWKENKVNPASGCLPLLIQFPILLGFYSMLQTAIELRGEGFLWAFDLSQTDTIAEVFGFPINPLPLCMGATMLWQAQLQPVSPSMDPAQQKVMKYMPLMFMVFLYNFSAGLTLYWTVSNLLSILQMKMTKAKDGPAPGSAAGGQGAGPMAAGPRSGAHRKGAAPSAA